MKIIDEVPIIVLIILTQTILIVFYIIRVRNGTRPKNKKFLNKGYFDSETIRLRNKYIRLYGDTRMAAAEVLDRQIEALKRKHPDKDMPWYIEKAIYDLKRDRHV